MQIFLFRAVHQGWLKSKMTIMCTLSQYLHTRLRTYDVCLKVNSTFFPPRSIKVLNCKYFKSNQPHHSSKMKYGRASLIMYSCFILLFQLMSFYDGSRGRLFPRAGKYVTRSTFLGLLNMALIRIEILGA